MHVRIIALGALATVALTATAGHTAATPEQKCQQERVKAWGKYQQCTENVVAKVYGGGSYDSNKAFWRCRHAYFGKWSKFQTKASLQGSSCVNNRFTDNGDGTVSDNLSRLVWETKTDDGSPRDKDNIYSWSTVVPYRENGTAFSSFLGLLNIATFGGANGWRLPTLAELQTILIDFSCSGPGGGPTCVCTGPCVAFGDPNTELDDYWSSTPNAVQQNIAWSVDFDLGVVLNDHDPDHDYVRAVRGGL